MTQQSGDSLLKKKNNNNPLLSLIIPAQLIKLRQRRRDLDYLNNNVSLLNQRLFRVARVVKACVGTRERGLG